MNNKCFFSVWSLEPAICSCKGDVKLYILPIYREKSVIETIAMCDAHSKVTKLNV